MKSLYNKWTKSRSKGEKHHGTPPVSGQPGSRGGSIGSRGPAGEAANAAEPSTQPRSSRDSIDVRPKDGGGKVHDHDEILH